MSNEVVHATQSALAVNNHQAYWTEQQLAALRQIGVENAPAADLAVFLNYSQRTGLDPFARQIYMIGRWSSKGTKWTIQASIDGLRIVAERSGEYAGQTAPEFCGEDGVWRDTWTSKEPPVAARVGVLRKGFQSPCYGIAYFEDYVQIGKDGKPTGLWSKPRIMLAKCAEALALRKAFPNDLSGLYTSEEMSQADHQPTPVQKPVQVAEPVQVDTETGEIVEGELVNDVSEEFQTLLDAIWQAYSQDELMKVAKQIRTAKIPPQELTDLRAAYTDRMAAITKEGKDK